MVVGDDDDGGGGDDGDDDDDELYGRDGGDGELVEVRGGVYMGGIE